MIDWASIGKAPVQIDVSMAHEADDDRCEVYVTETYDFDLAPIGMRYRQFTGRRTTGFAEDVGPVSLLRSALPLVGAVELLKYAPWRPLTRPLENDWLRVHHRIGGRQ